MLLRFKKYEPTDVKETLKAHGKEGLLNKFKFNSSILIGIKQIAESLDLDIFETFKIFEVVCLNETRLLANLRYNSSEGLIKKLTILCLEQLNNERGTTLKVIQLLMTTGENNTDFGRQCRGYLNELIRDYKLFENLWESYV